MRQEAHETAISACDSAEATRMPIQSDLDRTTAKASRLLKDTSRGQVADPKTLDALNRLLDAKTSTIKGSCAPDAVTSDVDRTTAALRRTTKELKNRLTDLKTAAKAVTDSKLDKTVDNANALYKQTDGKVADDKTRASLLDAIKKRDADAIAKAVKEVNESKMAKEKADAEAKAKAEQEATAANTLIFGRKPIPIPRKFRIRFRNRSTSVFGRLVVLQQYGRSLAGMVRAHAISRGHRLARQRSGVVIGFMPLPSILWSA